MLRRTALLAVLALPLAGCVSYQVAERGGYYEVEDGPYYSPERGGYGDYYVGPDRRNVVYGYDDPFYGFGNAGPSRYWHPHYDRGGWFGSSRYGSGWGNSGWGRSGGWSSGWGGGLSSRYGHGWGGPSYYSRPWYGHSQPPAPRPARERPMPKPIVIYSEPMTPAPMRSGAWIGGEALRSDGGGRGMQERPMRDESQNRRFERPMREDVQQGFSKPMREDAPPQQFERPMREEAPVQRFERPMRDDVQQSFSKPMREDAPPERFERPAQEQAPQRFERPPVEPRVIDEEPATHVE